MSSNSISPNRREILSAQSTIGGKQEYLTSTNGSLNVNAAVSISGVATSANQTSGAQKTQIVDGSGNVIGATSNALDINVKSGISTLALDATLTGGTQQTKITDGTNIAAVLASGTAQSTGNAQLIALTSQTQTWSVTSVSTGTVYDVGNYKSVSVHVSAQYTGTTPTITWQVSNDNANWLGQALILSTSTGTSAGVLSTTTTGIWEGNLRGRYFRLNFTGAYTSGTSTGTIVFSTAPSASVGGITGTLTVAGNKTNNAAVPGATNVGALVGIANAAQQTWIEGDQVLESMDLKGNQRIRISDAAGNDRGANVDANNNLGVVLAAETTKVLGVTRAADGAGNLLTSNSTTYTAKFGLDNNLLGTLGTAFTTAGKVDIKGADGDVFVRQATAGNLNATVVGTGTFAVQATVAAAATNIAKAEDVASADADVGVPAMAIRKATPANTSGTDGDYEMLQVSAGRLWASSNIDQINGVTPLMGNGSTGTGSLRVTIASDNTAFAVNPASATAPVSTMNSASANSGVNSALAAVFDDTTPTAITENSFGFVRMSANRNLYGTIRDAAGNERGANVDANNNLGVVLAAETTKVLGVTRTSDGAGNLLTTNSTTYTAKFGLDGNLLGTLGTAFSTAGKVDVKGADGDVFVRQATATNLKAQVVAGDATGSAVPANAFYQGVNAQTALPTAATAGNLTGATADKFGRQVVLNNAIRDIIGSQTTTISASTSETTIVTAAASIFNDIYALTVSNTSATAARVDFRDTTAGSVLFQLYIPAGDVRGVSWVTPIPQTTVNTNWTAQSSASVTDLRLTAWFVKNK